MSSRKEQIHAWLRASFEDEGLPASAQEWLIQIFGAGLGAKRLPDRVGGVEWAHHLALTMIPYFPEIVVEVSEDSDGELDITYDWRAFEKALQEVMRMSLAALLSDKESCS